MKAEPLRAGAAGGLRSDFFAAAGPDLAQSDIAFDVPLAGLGRWRIGGIADLVATPSTREALAACLRAVRDTGVPALVIGDGTNLLFDDAGFRGVVIRIGRRLGGVEIAPEGLVTAGAGQWVPTLVRRTIDAGLSGIVHAIGIPGTLGGLVAMNGGSQRHGIGEHVVHIDAMDRDGQIHRLQASDLGFAYRRSALQENGLVMVSATLRLEPGERAALRREAIDILVARRAKFPKNRANCGSVFVSDPSLYERIGPPGMAIERVGLKGRRCGGAEISPEHANFIVNVGCARSADVLSLIHLARDSVREAFGIAMDVEVRHVGPTGRLLPAHLVPPPERQSTACGE